MPDNDSTPPKLKTKDIDKACLLVLFLVRDLYQYKLYKMTQQIQIVNRSNAILYV